jgi:putative addiction module component (TIGR02574 family)
MLDTMKAAAKEVLGKALQLDEQDRAEIASALFDSLAVEDPEGDAAFAAELERRAAELDSGVVKGIPWEEVRAELWRGRGGA